MRPYHRHIGVFLAAAGVSAAAWIAAWKLLIDGFPYLVEMNNPSAAAFALILGLLVAVVAMVFTLMTIIGDKD